MNKPIQRASGAIVVVLIAALAAGCAAPSRYDDRSVVRSNDRGYRAVPPAGNSAYTQYGAVASIEPLGSGGRQTSGGGAIVGGVVGALIGHQMGHGGEKAAATALGVVGGAMLGNEIEKNQGGSRGSADGWRVVVRFNNGEQRAFDYSRLNDLRVGDRVRVVNNEVYRD